MASRISPRPTVVRDLPPELTALLGYAAYDGSARNGGLLGLYENGDPSAALPSTRV